MSMSPLYYCPILTDIKIICTVIHINSSFEWAINVCFQTLVYTQSEITFLTVVYLLALMHMPSNEER